MIAILAKITSETLLSFYPEFVKQSPLSIPLQLWSRFFAYSAVSLLFVVYSFVWNELFQPMSLLLAVVTLFHVGVSYVGFDALGSGVGFTLFYCYPLLILLFSGYHVPWLTLLVVAGAFMLAFQSGLFGVGMVLLAAITEAVIYFIVKKIRTPNPWNHLFLSYLLGLAALTAYCWRDLEPTTLTQSVGINTGLGLFGYVLLFYSIPRLSPLVYGILSMIGIFMAFVYGYLYGETPTWLEIGGAGLIAIAVALSKKA